MNTGVVTDGAPALGNGGAGGTSEVLFICAGCDKPKVGRPAMHFLGLEIGPCCAPGLKALLHEAGQGNVVLNIEVR